MLNRPPVMVSHSKQTLRWNCIFLIVADVFLRIKFKIYNTVLRTAEKSNMAIIDTVQLQ